MLSGNKPLPETMLTQVYSHQMPLVGQNALLTLNLSIMVGPCQFLHALGDWISSHIWCVANVGHDLFDFFCTQHNNMTWFCPSVWPAICNHTHDIETIIYLATHLFCNQNWNWIEFWICFLNVIFQNGLGDLGQYEANWKLTHCRLVTPYGVIDLGQHWFR